MNQQGLLEDKKLEGRFSSVYLKGCMERICGIRDWNVADETLFESLYRVVVECFSL